MQISIILLLLVAMLVAECIWNKRNLFECSWPMESRWADWCYRVQNFYRTGAQGVYCLGRAFLGRKGWIWPTRLWMRSQLICVLLSSFRLSKLQVSVGHKKNLQLPVALSGLCCVLEAGWDAQVKSVTTRLKLFRRSHWSKMDGVFALPIYRVNVTITSWRAQILHYCQ